MTVELEAGAATVEAAAERLGVDPSQIDAEYGVVSVDPDLHLYAVLVDEVVASTAAERPGVAGPFSNPRIEPFGPPRP